MLVVDCIRIMDSYKMLQNLYFNSNLNIMICDLLFHYSTHFSNIGTVKPDQINDIEKNMQHYQKASENGDKNSKLARMSATFIPIVINITHFRSKIFAIQHRR